MKNLRNILCSVFHLLLFCILVMVNGSKDEERKAYIVYMGELPENNEAKLSVIDEHHNLLSDIVGDVMLARKSRIHSYGRSFNGFVARLFPHEAAKLKEKESVISVFLNRMNKLLTTRSWDFIGMAETVKRNHEVESNMIVALLDTGVWMESHSFHDKGFGPPPKKWKGKCDTGSNFTKCNNKVIGAQSFDLENIVSPENKSPVDTEGHGTHTASTAAGVAVRGANLYGIAKGTARGGVPSARIASYKVCWTDGCQDMDLLAALDAAIADGVDIISISIGGPSRDYFEDPIAIGAFHALKKGILTSCAAGNDGPDFYTVQNVAPWLMTVAASGIDRRFKTAVKLGNGKVYYGVSINTFQPHKKIYPLTSGALAGSENGTLYGDPSACDDETLSNKKVKGEIVYCQGLGDKDSTISEMKGAGIIISSSELIDTAPPTILPTTIVSLEDGQAIDQYINSTKSAGAVIYRSTTVNITAPFVGSFSSRGPQSISLNILKPDIAAPGVSILAAFSQLTSLSGELGDNRIVKYNIESGTSMACPHVAAAAAYVKSFHPDWSPAAIKSALMTTVKSMRVKPVGGALASGSGMINPTKALHPGLVYDIDMDCYISFFCKEGYNSTSIALLTGSKKHDCSKVKPAKGADGLNYPSMHLQFQKRNTSNISAVFYRTVTNVAPGKSVYTAKIKSPKELSVSVVPKMLSFTKPHQRRSFKVVLTGKFVSDASWFLSASIVWSDSKHNVRSPILVNRIPNDMY